MRGRRDLDEVGVYALFAAGLAATGFLLLA